MSHSRIYRILTQVLFVGFFSLTLSGCLYENREEVFPEPEEEPVDDPCGTIDLSFAESIFPELQKHCLDCHSRQNAAGGVILEGFDNLLVYVNNGQFLGAVRHDPGFSAMPKNEGKLPDCDIVRIEAWIEAGAPNN